MGAIGRTCEFPALLIRILGIAIIIQCMFIQYSYSKIEVKLFVFAVFLFGFPPLFFIIFSTSALSFVFRLLLQVQTVMRLHGVANPYEKLKVVTIIVVIIFFIFYQQLLPSEFFTSST